MPIFNLILEIHTIENFSEMKIFWSSNLISQANNINSRE